jgi:hypothetical protein
VAKSSKVLDLGSAKAADFPLSLSTISVYFGAPMPLARQPRSRQNSAMAEMSGKNFDQRLAPERNSFILMPDGRGEIVEYRLHLTADHRERDAVLRCGTGSY